AAAAAAVAGRRVAHPPRAARRRRNQKSEQGPLAEVKARAGEPLAISPSRVASNSAPKAAGQSVQTPVGYGGAVASNSGEEERPLLAGLRQIPSWVLPENDRIFGELPRPPMPGGEFFRSSMYAPPGRFGPGARSSFSFGLALKRLMRPCACRRPGGLFERRGLDSLPQRRVDSSISRHPGRTRDPCHA